MRSSVFVYRNECLPQKQPCFPASAPVNSKMAGTDVTSYQSSSQKKKQASPPWGPVSKSNSRGWGRQKRSNAPHMPGVPPLGLNIDRCIRTSCKYLLSLCGKVELNPWAIFGSPGKLWFIIAVFKNGWVVRYTVYFIRLATSNEVLRAETSVISWQEDVSPSSS